MRRRLALGAQDVGRGDAGDWRIQRARWLWLAKPVCAAMSAIVAARSCGEQAGALDAVADDVLVHGEAGGALEQGLEVEALTPATAASSARARRPSTCVSMCSITRRSWRGERPLAGSRPGGPAALAPAAAPAEAPAR